MRRYAGWVLPLLLGAAGTALIILGQLDADEPRATLPPIIGPTRSAVAQSTSTASEPGPSPAATPIHSPSPTPIPEGVVAVQLQIESVGINVRVKEASDIATCNFPPDDAAYIICGGSQPGRGTNAYIFAHAVLHLFKPLWNVQIGAQVKVLLSDDTVLSYVVTEVRPNVPCPDPNADPVLDPTPPLALRYAPPGCDEGAAWTLPTDHERLTLQTSQGFNRNWGELIVVAEPAG